MRSRFNYANVTATLALFFAMSGGALAAKHYLISSTKQISPKVLKALKGNTGKQGAAGPAGAKGEAGTPGTKGNVGEKGEEGTYPTVLRSGATETGAWGGGYTAGGAAEYRVVGSFPIPLAATLNAEHVIYVSETSVPHCPGVGQAERGYLCVYQRFIEHTETPKSSNIFNVDEGGKLTGVGAHGFGIALTANAAALATVSGTFAVTAP